MKVFRLFILLIFSSVVAFAATEDGIRFESGTWKEITKKAKKENKLIFIDCYTDWCGPCKRLSAEIFPLKQVGAVFNENFINYKVDMEKGEGINLQKKFNVGAFPTLLWVNTAGEVVHRALGFMTADVLLKEAQKALTAGSYLSQLEVRYTRNSDDPEVTREYLNSLVKTADVRAKAIAEKYFTMIPKAQYLDHDVFEIIAGYLQTPFSPVGRYIFENRVLFEEKFKKSKMDVVAQNVYTRFRNSLLSQVKSGGRFDEDSFQKLITLMHEQKFENGLFFAENTRIKMFQHQKDWKSYAAKIDTLLAGGLHNNLRSGIFEEWYRVILDSDCKDAGVLKRAVVWTELGFRNDNTFNMVRLAKNLQARLSLLERMKGVDGAIEKTKNELALLNELSVKQNEFEVSKAARIKMLEAMSK